MRTNTLSKIALCVLSVAFCFSVIAVEKGDVAESAPKVYKIGKDGAPMVLIPAGEFQMGADPSEIQARVQQYKQYGAKASWFERETSRHTVYVDAFYMDIYEVTNAQYKKFMDATGHGAPNYWDDSNLDAPNQPVVGVSWHDAVAYAKWAGKRLPAEVEWEKAARGGLVGEKYPWGDSEPDGTQCNFADKNTNYGWSNNNVDDGHKYPAPVGSYRANGYGLYDTAGNVWEWCADWYSSRRKPKSLERYIIGSPRVLRGGSWGSLARNLRAARRRLPSYTNYYNGFRCGASRSD